MVQNAPTMRVLLSGKRDSNSRPPAWEASALPTELLPQFHKTAAKVRKFSESTKCFRFYWLITDVLVVRDVQWREEDLPNPSKEGANIFVIQICCFPI